MLNLLNRNETWARFAVVAGVFAWLAITFYNFTQDSLTTPNIWIVPGILVGLAAKSYTTSGDPSINSGQGFALPKNKETE